MEDENRERNLLEEIIGEPFIEHDILHLIEDDYNLREIMNSQMRIQDAYELDFSPHPSKDLDENNMKIDGNVKVKRSDIEYRPVKYYSDMDVPEERRFF